LQVPVANDVVEDGEGVVQIGVLLLFFTLIAVVSLSRSTFLLLSFELLPLSDFFQLCFKDGINFSEEECDKDGDSQLKHDVVAKEVRKGKNRSNELVGHVSICFSTVDPLLAELDGVQRNKHTRRNKHAKSVAN